MGVVCQYINTEVARRRHRAISRNLSARPLPARVFEVPVSSVSDETHTHALSRSLSSARAMSRAAVAYAKSKVPHSYSAVMNLEMNSASVG